jgi:hypothetical protein
MPFGKHAGKRLDEVPPGYLVWVLENCRRIDPDLREAIEQMLEEGGSSEPDPTPGRRWRTDPPAGPDWPAVIRQWYRSLCFDFHPDRGGTTEAMQAINEAHDRLRRLLRESDGSTGQGASEQ